MPAGNINLPDGYVKELRQFVKKNKSGHMIYTLLNDIYKAGYRQATIDNTEKLRQQIEMIEQMGNANEEVTTISEPVDGLSDSGIPTLAELVASVPADLYGDNVEHAGDVSELPASSSDL